MAVPYPKPLARLVGEFEKLPGIGPKSAQRLAFYVSCVCPKRKLYALADAVTTIKASIKFCRVCHNYSEGEVCDICADTRRDHARICVVAEPRDLIAMEKTGEFKGVYHVLQGVISPLNGVMPDKLRIKELEQRVAEADPKVEEIILATNPTVEGDTTSLYIAPAPQTAGRQSHPHRTRNACRRRFRLRRPGHAHSSIGVQARTLTAYRKRGHRQGLSRPSFPPSSPHITLSIQFQGCRIHRRVTQVKLHGLGSPDDSKPVPACRETWGGDG